MNKLNANALFLGAEETAWSDQVICNGEIPAELRGRPCPYSNKGAFPGLVTLNKDDPNYSIDKGKPGDLCPACAISQLANLGHWQGHGGQFFPEVLLPLRLFKCRMGLWLVVPGLLDEDATQLQPNLE